MTVEFEMSLNSDWRTLENNLIDMCSVLHVESKYAKLVAIYYLKFLKAYPYTAKSSVITTYGS